MWELTGWRWRRARTKISLSIWVVPTVYATIAICLAIGLTLWDHNDPLSSSLQLSSTSASTALAALASGMIVFTGFVTSVVLLIIQFGSNQFSPRFLRWFRNDPTVKHSLGTFIATFLFALIATTMTGSGPHNVVPYRALIGALLLSIASVGWFLALISNSSNNMRVAHVTQRVDSEARSVFDLVYSTESIAWEAAQSATEDFGRSEPVQALHREGVGKVLVSVDRRILLRLAIKYDVVIELVAAVGDHVATEGLILRVYGEQEIPQRRLLQTVSFGDERTIEADPAFTIRLLVDVAIKALSPAVNDPTTAVQCLHRIEDVLRYASSKHLSVGVATDLSGRARVVLPTPTWDDLVSLSFDEIRRFGATQYQVTRRVRALINDLLRDLPERRHDVLNHQVELWEDAVAANFTAAQRPDALVADSQGLGLGRK